MNDQEGSEPEGQASTHERSADMVRADRRWDISTGRDWIILGVMVLIFVAYATTMYLFEPGIR